MIKTLTTTLGLLLAALGWAAAAATLLGFFGSAWWALDLLANFRPQLAVVLVAAAIVYGITAGRLAGLVFAAAGLVNVLLLLPLYLSSPAPPVAGGSELSIVSFNVRTGNADRSEVVGWLAATNADIVVVLESSEDWERAIRSAGLPYDIVASPPPERRFGTTVLAKDPIPTDIIRIGPDADTVVRATVAVGDTAVTLLAVHPRAPYNHSDAARRDRVLAAVANRAAADPAPVIVVGDLNASPWSHAFRNLTDTADLVNSLGGYGLQPTWPAGVPFFAIPIDHLLHSAELTTVARSTGPALGSDHRPLLVTVAFAAADDEADGG